MISCKDNRPQEEILEEKDIAIFEDLKLVRLKKFIKDFLGARDNKLNQLVFDKDKLFSSYHQRINYYYDIFLVPTFKNHLCNFKDKLESIDQYRNMIDHGICRYLNSLKIKIQREKDTQSKVAEIIQSNKEQEKSNEEKQEEKDDDINKKSKNLKKDKDNYIITQEKESKKEKESLKEKEENEKLKEREHQEMTYEYEMFFGKLTRYSQTQIASAKAQSIIYLEYSNNAK